MWHICNNYGLINFSLYQLMLALAISNRYLVNIWFIIIVNKVSSKNQTTIN